MRQAGDQVRITAQLIDTETGFHLWSETYDRKLEDIFAVQDEIAQAIVDRLRIQLAPEEQQLAQREKAPTQDVEAYELYLQGTRDLETARRGKPASCDRVCTRRRSASDPAFAPRERRAGLGVRRAARLQQGKGRRREIPPARRSSRRGRRLSLDPKIGEAHAVLAQINSERGNLLDAESGFFFAISLEPNEPTPHHWYSILLQKVGRLDAALTQARRAYRARPQLADHRREPRQRVSHARRG